MRLFVFLYIIITLAGCTRTNKLYRHSENSELIERINIQGKEKGGIIKLVSDRNVYFKMVQVKNDSLQYQPLINDSLYFYNIKEVRYIEFSDHFVGAFDGFLIGFSGGALIAVASDHNEKITNSANLIVSLGCGLFGAISGAAKGTTIRYKFINEKIVVKDYQ
ncbi:MAG: hypothetical protein P8X42_06610 [Calditrichaceae bacterium]|jgi:hypothetical protein